MRRLIAALFVAAVTLLALEGALSLAGQPSLVRRLPRLWFDAAPAAQAPLTDAERRRAAAENPGIWRAHPDPRVGYVLRHNSQLLVLDGVTQSDSLGLRSRPGPASEDAFRIALVGASIPFGFGVNDDQTLAHRLELSLNAARGPGARPVEVRTVAMIRWNIRNAVSFMLDHLPELQADLVLVMPYENDLSDTDAVDETGHRRAAPDAASPDPLLSVRMDTTYAMVDAWSTLKEAGSDVAPFEELGTFALTADIGSESVRHYDENAALLLHLRERLAQRGARLAWIVYREVPHSFHLLRRMQAAVPDLPVIPLFTSVPIEFTLLSDAHPSVRTIEVLADWIAADLFRLGLVEPGAGLPLPPAPPEYAAQRAPERRADEIEARALAEREQSARELQPVIDLRTGRGVRQVYGGCSVQGTVGPHMLALLPRGPTLSVDLSPLPDRPDLYPLRVQVLADGAPVGELRLEAGAPAHGRFPLPDGGPVVEIKLVAEDWIVARFEKYTASEIASYHSLRLSCECE